MKKVAALLLFLLILAGCERIYHYTEDDAIEMKEILMSDREPTKKEMERLDLNGDGRISLSDLVLLRQKLMEAEDD